MRNVSQAVQTVLDSDYGETRDVVIITIKEQIEPPFPETILYYANGEDVSIGGQDYDNKLRGIGTIKFSLSSSPDNAEINLENVSRELGFVLTDTTRIFDGASVEIKKAFKISDGTFEPVTLFVGQITDTKVNQELITFNVVSDMNRRGTSVAGRTVTQRCIFRFNVNGSGIGPNCGWQTTQPGDPLSCDHDLNSLNGCRSHGNVHRFGGVPAFTAITPGNGYEPNTGTGWGSGSGGGWCVHPDTWLLCESKLGRYWVKASAVKEGEEFLSLDKFNKFVQTKVINVNKGITTHIYTLITKKGYELRCSPSHPVITSFEDVLGTPCHTLQVGSTVLVSGFSSKTAEEDKIESIEFVEHSCNVILFQLEEPLHIFVAGNTQEGGILSHNVKPLWTDYGSYPTQPMQPNQF